jgi:hypothetical protein
MPKKDHTHLVCILDRSGSMGSVAGDAIGGFNTFLEDQKKQPGTMTVSLVLFDNEYLMPVKNEEISKVEPLTSKTFVPRGMTALLDAIGKTINDTNAELAKLPKKELPENVIVCILTDGQENASKEFKREQIKQMIENQKKDHGWEFVFLAANQDAFSEAGSIGIDRDNTFNYRSDSKGTKDAFNMMCESVTDLKSKKSKK